MDEAPGGMQGPHIMNEAVKKYFFCALGLVLPLDQHRRFQSAT